MGYSHYDAAMLPGMGERPSEQNTLRRRSRYGQSASSWIEKGELEIVLSLILPSTASFAAAIWSRSKREIW